ncbi:effector-associated constant component EACC1 [Nonomuraea jabiensis]|uniref:effector-associated constant component EACC1 n=1 Tax=Nonomuraea jabiensis TaxID=882448 RepID=UPI003D759F7F
MDVRVSIEDEEDSRHLESLRHWIGGTAELKGRVNDVTAPPPPGTLGPFLESIVVALSSGAAGTALASALLSWVRQQSGAVKVQVDLPDGRQIHIDATQVKALSAAELREQVGSILRELREAEEKHDQERTADE